MGLLSAFSGSGGSYSKFNLTVKDVVFGGADNHLYMNFGTGLVDLPKSFICSTDPQYGGYSVALNASHFPFTTSVICVADGQQNIGFFAGPPAFQDFYIFTENWAGGGTWSGLTVDNPGAPTGDTTFTVETVGGSSCCTATYTASFTSTAEGICSMEVAAGTFTDEAGNTNTVSNLFQWTYETTRPTMTITSPTISSGSSTGDPTIDVTFTSSEDTTDFDSGDVTVTNGSISAFSASDSYSNFTITVKDVVFGGTDTVLLINFGSGRSQTPELPVDFTCSTDAMYGGNNVPNGGAQASLQAPAFPWTTRCHRLCCRWTTSEDISILLPGILRLPMGLFQPFHRGNSRRKFVLQRPPIQPHSQVMSRGYVAYW